MQHTFQEEVRRALTKYALMPVLILAVLGSLLMLFSWKHYVTGTNHEQRAVVAEVMQGIFADYWQRTERAVATLETSADLTQWQTDPQKRAEPQACPLHRLFAGGGSIYRPDPEQRSVGICLPRHSRRSCAARDGVQGSEGSRRH